VVGRDVDDRSAHGRTIHDRESGEAQQILREPAWSIAIDWCVRWIWLFTVVGCGDNVTPRLEQVRYDVDGIEVADPRLFHDLARGEDCVATPWADGATYCTPAYSDAVYTDPICSKPLARTIDPPSGYAATYFILNGQATLRRLHSVLAEVPPPPQYWVLQGAECQGPYVGDASAHFAAVELPLDETQFVRLRRSAPEGDGRIQRISFDTSDGLHVPAAFRDRELTTDCTLEFARDVASPRCVPGAAAAATVFGDDACSQPVLVAPERPPTFATFGTADCPSYALLAGDVTGQPVFDRRTGQCAPVTLPEGYPLYSVGAPLDLAVVTRERGIGTRIQPITVVSGTLRVADTAVHDTQLAADCWPGLLAGTSRCLPATTGILTYFIDDQCRDPIDVAFLEDGTCSPQPRYAARPDEIHAIGEPVPMELYEISTGDRCVPFSATPPLVAHLVSPPLTPETFAAADVRY
jgi:hypothetical protein